ncbi:MAG: energy transducer TonB [Bacteroidetes bacterium]|jgi:TonB family protein|nr:energy transducer TonB [Bacteroidota bacterium]MBT5528334.1 energy transducer TonB [Cytophagia bacterium]MBT3421642.1 energy transducer TonB [Bacteroidota bacterium]MBT3933080.1 energy transducer TonB [Bacteroidota bacterium]MBT4337500.1 energy transducer TonB [Bacteroidota bacterium]
MHSKLYFLTILLLLFLVQLTFSQTIDSSKTKKEVPDIETNIIEDFDIEVINIPIPEDELNRDDAIYYVVEDQPEFVGGMDSIQSFISKNLIYPQLEKENGIQGLVVVNFIVEKDGSISNAKIIKSLTPGFDAEVLRLVKLMPAWKPGKQRGVTQRVFINYPIRFSLD